MSEESNFNSTFELLSKVVKAGRAEQHLLSSEKMDGVVQAYREAERRSGGVIDKRLIAQARDGNLQLSKEQIQKLGAGDVKTLLERRELQSINGIGRERLKKEFDEAGKIANEQSAVKAVKERLEREPEQERRHSQNLDKLRKTERTRNAEPNEPPAIQRERERKRNR